LLVSFGGEFRCDFHYQREFGAFQGDFGHLSEWLLPVEQLLSFRPLSR
jgi:hypothetical protein